MQRCIINFLARLGLSSDTLKPTWLLLVANILLLLVISLLDLVASSEVDFSVFYFAPIVLVAWWFGFAAAAVMAVMATGVWVMNDILSGPFYDHRFLRWINALNLGLALILIGRMVTVMKGAFDREQKLSDDLRGALRQVNQLSGMLPICASCKRIRNDGGYWEQIEGYIRSHSQAEFSHGICPECANTLYPGLMTDAEMRDASQPTPPSVPGPTPTPPKQV